MLLYILRIKYLMQWVSLANFDSVWQLRTLLNFEFTFLDSVGMEKNDQISYESGKIQLSNDDFFFASYLQ